MQRAHTAVKVMVDAIAYGCDRDAARNASERKPIAARRAPEQGHRAYASYANFTCPRDDRGDRLLQARDRERHTDTKTQRACVVSELCAQFSTAADTTHPEWHLMGAEDSLKLNVALK